MNRTIAKVSNVATNSPPNTPPTTAVAELSVPLTSLPGVCVGKRSVPILEALMMALELSQQFGVSVDSRQHHDPGEHCRMFADVQFEPRTAVVSMKR